MPEETRNIQKLFLAYILTLIELVYDQVYNVNDYLFNNMIWEKSNGLCYSHILMVMQAVYNPWLAQDPAQLAPALNMVHWDSVEDAADDWFLGYIIHKNEIMYTFKNAYIVWEIWTQSIHIYELHQVEVRGVLGQETHWNKRV